MRLEYVVVTLLAFAFIWRITLPGVKFGRPKVSTQPSTQQSWYKSLWWLVVPAVAGMAYYVSWGAPSPERVWLFFQSYWLWVVLILAGLYFLSGALDEKWVKAGKGMVVTLAVLLAGAMAVHGIWGDGEPSDGADDDCEAYFNSTDVSRCVISEKAVEVTSSQLTAAGEFEFCVVVPQGSPIRIESVRTNTFKMWSTDGNFPAQFKWVRTENLTDGDCPSAF